MLKIALFAILCFLAVNAEQSVRTLAHRTGGGRPNDTETAILGPQGEQVILLHANMTEDELIGGMRGFAEIKAKLLKKLLTEIAEKPKEEQEKALIEHADRVCEEIKELLVQSFLKPALSGVALHAYETQKEIERVMEDMTVRQARILHEAANKVDNQPIDEQERALIQAAEVAGGENIKSKVEKIIELKDKHREKMHEEFDKVHQQLSEEAKNASAAMLNLLTDEKMAVAQKLAKVDEMIKDMPEKVQQEINLKNVSDVKELIESHHSASQMIHMGIGL